MAQCHTYIYTWKNFYKKYGAENKKFIYINIWCDIVSFVTISQVWRCEVMAKHHHSDLPGSWLQNTKPYQLPPKNSIFWSSDFEKIPFLPPFLYKKYTKSTQMTQMTHIFCMWKKFYKKSKEQNGKTKKNIYTWYIWCVICVICVIQDVTNMEQKKFFIYIYLYIYKFAETRILWTWYRSIQTMYFYCFLKLYIFCTKMAVLSVLSYIYKKKKKKNKKKHGAEKEKIFYIYKYKPYDISDISAILVYFLTNFSHHLPKNF